jgi:hypothetical protein
MRAIFSHHDVALMRALAATPDLVAIDRDAEEMQPRLGARHVNVVILVVLAHGVCACESKDLD